LIRPDQLEESLEAAKDDPALLQALKAEAFLNIPPLTWDNLSTPLLNHPINAFEPLMLRVDESKLMALSTH